MAKEKIHTGKFLNAVFWGNADIVEQALAEGMDVNARDADEDTALILAARRPSNLEVVKLLLDTPGVNVDAWGELGMTALVSSVRFNNTSSTEIIEALIAAKADCTICDNRRNTALHWVSGRCPDAVFVLHRAGVDINARGEEGYTPLMRKVSSTHLAGYDTVIRNMIECGANLLIKNVMGQTALDIFLGEQDRDPKIEELLKTVMQKQVEEEAIVRAAAENRALLSKNLVKFRLKP